MSRRGSRAAERTGRAGVSGRGRALIAGVSALVVASLLTLVPPTVAGAATAGGAGSQGTNTALPPTSSAVTVTPSAATIAAEPQYAGLKITVSQTENLVNQAVSVTWSGGAPTESAAGTDDIPFAGSFDGNYLQIFQCWSDGTQPGAGPSPQQCEFGGYSISVAPNGDFTINSAAASGFSYSRQVGEDYNYLPYEPPGGVMDRNGYDWMPFEPVDYRPWDPSLYPIANASANPAVEQIGGSSPYWLNPYFNSDTTNEDPYALTYADGRGSELFTLDTGLEAPSLGCGQTSQPLQDGATTTPKCWLVVVPRGTPAQENPAAIPSLATVETSPLDPTAWSHRITIPLQFQPVGGSCSIGANELRITGGELASSAVSSWQPALCTRPGVPPYSYSAIGDDQARQQLVNGQYGAAGMAVVTQPLDPSTVAATNPVTYAPLTLSGTVIGFNIERDETGTCPLPGDFECDYQDQRVEHMNLTPRLVAKLLTESYRDQFRHLGVPPPVPAKYNWVTNNPVSLIDDPDFKQFNPEFALTDGGGSFDLYTGSSNPFDASGLVVEEATSDAAQVLWQWVLSDPEAAAWLAGQPDQWGMQVNPLYNTVGVLNPNRAPFGTPTPNSYPKSDPYCDQDQTNIALGSGSVVLANPLCMQDTLPYALTMRSAAQETRLARDGSKTGGPIVEFPPYNPASAWTSTGAEAIGNRLILSITDAASAAQYGLQTANLSQDGDDRANRAFIAPDQPGLLAGEGSMGPSPATASVLIPNPTTTAAGAYPLAMLTYAAITPGSIIDAGERQDYANFITYGAGPGQTPGTSFGELPAGYVPLPAALRAQAVTAAQTIAAGASPVPTTTTVASTSTTTTSTTTVVPATVSGTSGADLFGGDVSGLVPLAAGVPTGTLPTNSPVIGPLSPSVTVPGTTTPGRVTLTAKSSPTPALAVGAVRYVLPTFVAVGVAAALAARVLGRRRRNAKAALLR